MKPDDNNYVKNFCHLKKEQNTEKKRTKSKLEYVQTNAKVYLMSETATANEENNFCALRTNIFVIPLGVLFALKSV